jgi:cell division protein FtsB
MSHRLLALGVGMAMAAVLGVYGVSGALRVRALHQEIASAQREIAALRAQAEKLTLAIDRLRNDPAYIEKLGREEHGLVREGETVLKFPPKSK